MSPLIRRAVATTVVATVCLGLVAQASSADPRPDVATSTTAPPPTTAAPTTAAPTTAAPTTAAPTTAAPTTAAATTAAPTQPPPTIDFDKTNTVEGEAEGDSGVIEPGAVFGYRFQPTCSGGGQGCVDLTITDVFPPDVVVDEESLPLDNTGREVTWVPETRTLTVVYTAALASPAGQTGMAAGDADDFTVNVTLPADTTVGDGAVITNEATIAAANASAPPDDTSLAVSVPPVPATEPPVETEPGTTSSEPESTTVAPTTTVADDDPPIVIFQAPGQLGLQKDASVEDASPGDSFTYTLIASCSGLEHGCVDAVLTDVVPPEVEISALPPDTAQYDVAFDAATRTLTVTFLIALTPPDPPGSVGMPAGSSFNIEVGVAIPPESQVADGSVITNEGVLNDDSGVPATDTAEVEVDVPLVVTPVATKTWSDGGAVAGTGEASTISLGVRNASSSTALVDELVVEDADADVFERFDVTAIGPVTMPAGADQVVVLACTNVLSACADADYSASPPQSGPGLTLPPGIDAGDVTGLRFVFSNAAGTPLPYDPTGGRVDIGLELRDTIRSTGAPYQPTVVDNVQNCATPSAVEPVAGTVEGDDACATSSVFPAQATIAVAKSFFSDTNGNFTADGRAVIGLGSPVSALTSVTNTSPFPVATITITEPSATSATEYSKVDVSDLRLVFPAGATTAELTVECDDGTVLETSFTAPPTTVNVATGCSGDTADSVAVTYTGVDGDGNATIAQGAVAQLGVHGPLNGTETDADVDDGIVDCADGAATSSIDGVGSAAGNACATLDLFPAFSQVRGTKTAQLPTLLPGLPRLFTLSFTNSGTIPATNVVMADPLDPLAPGNPFENAGLFGLVLPATPPGGVAEVYDPDAGGYVPYVESDTALLERALGFRVTVPSVPAGATYNLSFSVRLREGVPPGTTFRNCGVITTDTETSPQFCSQLLTVIEASSGAALQKSIVPASSVHPQPGLPAATVQSKFALQNTGTLFLRQLQMVDNDPAFYDAVDLTGTVRVNFPPGADRVRVDVCTGACTSWVNGTVTGSQNPTIPASVPLADIRGVRVTFTAVPVSVPGNPSDEYRIRPGTNFPTTGPCTGASVCISFRPRAELRSAPGTPAPDTIVNTATGGFESRQQPPGTLAPIPATSATHTLTAGTGQLQFSKGPNTTAAPGVPFVFNLRATNTGTGPIPDPVIVEPIPEGIDFSPTDPATPFEFVFVVPAGGPEPPDPVFTTTVDPDTGRVTELRWEFPEYDLLPGGVLAVQFQAMLAPGVTAGQVIENRAGGSGDRPDLTCNTTGVPRPGQVVDDPEFGSGRFCTSGALVTVTAGNAFRSEKWVAGDASLGFLNTVTGDVTPVDGGGCPLLSIGGRAYTRFPCVARVLPGNDFDFYLRLTNTGTNPTTELRLVDVFPAPGDTGVILTGSSRGTEWDVAPTLASGVSLAGPGALNVGYTSASPPVCTTELNRPPVACPGGAWSGGGGAGSTAFRAIITFATPLPPGGTTALQFSMSAPPNPAADSQDDVAWNSFAYTPFFQQGAQVVQLPPTEPIKTGVAVVFGSLEVVKEIGDNPAGLPVGDLEFTFEYTCAVGGTTVRSGEVTATTASPGTVPGIPAGATCSVVETVTHGAVTSAPPDDPATTVIAVDGTAPAVGSVTVTNDFPIGRLDVTKAVTGDAQPEFTAGPYVMSVDCTYLDESLDGFPTEVSLDPDETVGIDAPVGATCVVTETDDAGATTVTYEPADGTVTIPAEDEPSIEVVVTNDFAIGSLVIVKDVIGAGVPQFSGGPFEFTVTCAYDGVADAFTTTVTVPGSADGSTVQSEPIAGLPIGSECTVTETDSAGSDFTPLAEAVTIVANDSGNVVSATFLDPFSAGTISVSKAVDGDAAELIADLDLTYAIGVQCAVEVDGVRTTLLDTTLEVAAGEQVTALADDGNPVLLPVDARCWGTEVTTGGASQVAIDFDSFENGVAVLPVAEGPQPLTISVTNTYDPAVVAVSKTVVGIDDDTAEYTFTISCTLTDLDGTTIRLPLPSDGVFTLGHGEVAAFDTVAGARCAVVEFDAPPGATGTIIDEDGTEQDVSDGVVTVTESATVDFTNTFAPAPPPTTDVGAGEVTTTTTTTTLPESILPRTE